MENETFFVENEGNANGIIGRTGDEQYHLPLFITLTDRYDKVGEVLTITPLISYFRIQMC